jgi:hypothetical protein
MKKLTLYFLTLLVGILATAYTGVRQDDFIASGLKEALSQGITKGVSNASAVDGFLKNPLLKIPFPPDIKMVEDQLRRVGLGGEVDRFVTSMNRGAESAAKEALPIFLNSIKNISMTDAIGLLKGGDNAATNFLKNTTQEALVTAFKPKMQESLGKVEATKYYGQIMGKYNRLPFVQKVNPDLNDYATRKAIDGLFVLVAQEEKNIRANPAARATELLKSVFKN